MSATSLTWLLSCDHIYVVDTIWSQTQWQRRWWYDDIDGLWYYKKINCQNYLDVWRWIGSRGSDAFPRTKARGFHEGDHSVSPVLNKHDLDTILIKALNYYHWIGHWSTGNEYILDLSWKTSFVNLYFQNCIGVIRLNLKCKSSTKKCQTYLRRLVKGHTVKQKAPDRAKIQDMSHVDNVCDLILSPPPASKYGFGVGGVQRQIFVLPTSQSYFGSQHCSRSFTS